MNSLTLKLMFLTLTVAVGPCAGRKGKGRQRCRGPGQEAGWGAPWLQLSAGAWKRFPAVYLMKELETHGSHWLDRSAQGCPKLLQPNGSDPSHRSISPWTYRVDVDKDRLPERLVFAECLCRGCIDTGTGREEHHLNSVLLEQAMMVLRRLPCPRHRNRYSVRVETIRVPVGCTCVVPRTHSLLSA